jgi:tyrosyl-tRNA synthetase
MSISDELMWRYYDLLSMRPVAEIREFKHAAQNGANPRDYKIKLAEELITRFHNADAAEKATESFIARFQKGAMPEVIEEKTLSLDQFSGAFDNGDGYGGGLAEGIPLWALLKWSGLVSSSSDALRMIKQNAVKIDGEKISDPNVNISVGTEHIYQIGKRRFLKINLKD